MAGRRGTFNPFSTAGRGNAIPNMVRPSIPSLSVDKPVSSPQVVNPDSLFSDPGMGGGQMREIMNILPQLPPEKIKQFIPQLPPEVIKQVAPQLPPEIIREIAPSLPPEIIREVIPQLPPEIIREIIPQLPIEVMQEVIPQLPPEIAQQVAPPEVLEAVRVRKDANDAKSSATDQYEADVADFKNTQATEAEQGIASLPEVSTLSQGQIVPEGLGSFVPPQQGGPQFGGIPAEGFGPKPQFDPDSLFSDPFMGGGEPPFQGRRPQEGPFAPPPPPPMGGPDFNPFMGGNIPIPNLPPQFDPDSLFSDPNLGGGEPPFQGRRPFEPPVVEEPFTPPLMGGGEEPYIPPPFMGGGEPPFNTSPGGGSFYDDLFGGGDFSGIDFSGIDFVPPPPVDLGTGESSDNTGTVPPRGGGGRPPRVPNLDLINGGGEESGNSYPGNPMGPGFQLPPDFGGGLPYLPDDNEPFDPGYGVPPGGGLPPGGEPLPQPPAPPPYDGPVNPYTGEFVQDPYQPYATDSGATPLVRKMTPEQFGQAPGMGPPLRTMPYPQGPFPMPPPMGPVMGYPEQRLGMFNGGYLNNGISQLPTNQQGDTLTQQVFQSGFRPRS